MPTDLLKNLALDRWYKVLLLIGSVLLLSSVVVEVKVLSNQQIMLLGASFTTIGLGEWMTKGTKMSMRVLGFQPIQVTEQYWRFNFLGVLLDIVGLFLLYSFINSLFGFPLYQPFIRITPTLPPVL